jgi:dynein heavy chain
MSTLKGKQDNLHAVQDKVAKLEAQLNEAVTEKKRLSDQAALCEARLGRAGMLTDALGSEQIAWTEMVGVLGNQIDMLTGDVFLGAACVAYYGPFTGIFRNEIVSEWVEECRKVKVQVSQPFSLVNTLAKPVEVREWNLRGLPSDALSIDNGVCVKIGQRWPLMIDPQMQANKWIKAMEDVNGLRLIKLSDPNFLRTLESSIRVGNPVLLEDLKEDLDPSLEPILLKQLFKQGGRILIRVGEQDVDYDPAFKLYMTSKMPNPHYLPDVCIKVTLINFVITLDGLEDQLLGDVVKKEKPALEETKQKLVVSMAADKKQLDELQDKVLKLLKESEGMILDNEPLINTLQQSKMTTTMIFKRVTEATETDKNIAIEREGYRSVATRGSMVYFVIADLAEMDPMYQYSLEYFKKLYNYCIDVSTKSDDLATRLDILINFITDFMYKNVCRGLFEKHKLVFSFLICTTIQRQEGQVSNTEWNYILRGNPAIITGGPKNPDPSFIKQREWEAIQGCETMLPSIFKGLAESIAGNLKPWKQWTNAEMPQDITYPSPWDGTLNSFQKMIVLKIFREEKLVFATSKFVEEKMGRSFTESPPIQLAEIYPDTDYQTPVIFVLSSGSDPTGSLIKFAEEMNYLNRLQSISLGQGQGPIAEKYIGLAIGKGDWVCCMNCHLASSWMPSLERLVDEFKTGAVTVAPAFRLWLTSMPSPQFPVAVLQNGIKLTYEPPKGLRANLIGTFTTLAEEWDCCQEGRDGRDELHWKKLLVGLAFFHAVVQERRKYKALGWNILYEFNTSDILCAKDVLKMFTKNFDTLPWDALTYVTGHVNYGGRVTDDNDRKALMCILSQYYTPSGRVVNDETYKFSNSGTYFSPPVGSYDDLMTYLRNLPQIDNPEVFGMHANANIAFQLNETRAMYDTMLSIQPRVATSKDADVKSPEEIVDDLAAVFEEECPADFPHDQAGFGKDQHAHSLFILQPNGWLCCCVAVGVCVSRAHARMSALALRDHFARLSRLVLVSAVVQS